MFFFFGFFMFLKKKSFHEFVLLYLLNITASWKTISTCPVSLGHILKYQWKKRCGFSDVTPHAMWCILVHLHLLQILLPICRDFLSNLLGNCWLCSSFPVYVQCLQTGCSPEINPCLNSGKSMIFIQAADLQNHGMNLL